MIDGDARPGDERQPREHVARRRATARACAATWLLTTPKSSFSSPAQTSSDRKPGIAYGMTRIERYVRWKRMPFLSSAIARNSPAANEKKTHVAAKKNVQAKIERNGLRTSGSWMIRAKLRKPT